MKMTRFTCAAFDLDGTLLNAHSQLSVRTKKALEALYHAGIPVIVASGRPFSTIPSEILEEPAVRYIVTGNGVRIYDQQAQQDIYSCALTAEALKEILHVAHYYPVGYEFFVEGRAFANSSFLADMARFGVPERAFHYMKASRQPVEDVAAFIKAYSGSIDSMGLSMADMFLKKQLWGRLEKEVEGIYVTSSVPRLIEIADQRAGKASALAVILEKLGLDPSGMAAFGDADNDLGMLELAGCGVAMANGDGHLKAAADRIAPHHDEDGVAQVLEELLKEF